MKLNTIFSKPVDRPIEGVIKADDNDGLRMEIDEYVITNEVEKRLEEFIAAYANYNNANGVWISGFFGSGKSHLLKMLALVLENRDVEGMKAGDAFLGKCRDNQILRADLHKSIAIPSQSILFNIDQKADVIHKGQTDALMAVFVKVFDETCGYYGKQPHIAKFERDLDQRGQYENFKAAYERIAGKPWHAGREQHLLEASAIASAYAEVSGDMPDAAKDILRDYRATYKLSIEDFAEQVLAYVNQRGPHFRLNFFVDEAGQYIADNTKLMTNLQTVAESLATKCRGRAWVLVTSQEDMNTVVGEMGKQQTNDFTKIQARFANRMKLTSADVAEVIQKRLLAKTEGGAGALRTLYHQQVNNFRTLFDFTDGAQTYRNFHDQDHFVWSYPFIPYQFSLFQSAIQNLSHHNAFEGRHSSVGERSMLAVFQEVAIAIGEMEVGQLATFDLMFEGIRKALKSSIQRAIIQAEQHLENPFAVRVLKALFLVKYVKEFKATVRNMRVLMQDAFDRDTPKLELEIENALNLLEQQTYIQRNGELYEYLTDEEKDVEEEIKNTDVDQADVLEEIDKLVFDNVLKARKIRHESNGQDYVYARKVDDRLKGKDYELSINVITAYHDLATQFDALSMQSVAKDELIVVLPPDDRFARDVLMYKKTEKYVRHSTSAAQQDATKRILTEKANQNHARFTEIQHRLVDLLGRARLFVHGTEVEVASAEPVARITKGFQALLTRCYPNLAMLPAVTFTENDIGKFLRESSNGLFDTESLGLTEPEQEVFNLITGNKRNGIRTPVKTVLEKFERKPYGWYYAAMLCYVAKLCAKGKVEARVDGNLLDHVALEKQLRNSGAHPNLLLEPQEEIPPSQVRALKDLFDALFDSPAPTGDTRALVLAFSNELSKLINVLQGFVAQSSKYPFVTALTEVIQQYKAHEGKPPIWFFTELLQRADGWLEHKETLVDPITRFFEGNQRNIYDEARAWVEQNMANLAQSKGEAATAVIDLLANPTCYKGNQMQQLKAQLDAARAELATALSQERERAGKRIAERQTQLTATVQFKKLTPDQQSEITQAFPAAVAELNDMVQLVSLQARVSTFEKETYPALVSRMAAWIDRPGPPGPDDKKSDEIVPPPPEPEFVSISRIRVDFEKLWLGDEADVDR